MTIIIDNLLNLVIIIIIIIILFNFKNVYIIHGNI